MRDLPASKRVLEMRRIARARRIRLIIFICILFFSVFFALSYFSFSSKLSINNVEVKGNRILESSDIKEVVFKKLEGKYFYLFSRANFLLVPQKQIYKELLLSFPRIEKLDVSRHGLHTLNINIVERVGVYLYCGEKVPEISKDIGDNCFYVNADGLIFDKAPYFSGNIYFKFYKKLENKDVIKGQILMPKQDFQKITSFVDGLIDNGLKPNYLIYEENGQNNLYLDNKPLSTQPKIIFKNDNDLSVILNNLSASMKKQEFKDEINSKYDKLLYIDLRFKNKVLYKFNDEQ